MTGLFHDIRYTFRLWRAEPLTTIAAITCLALGIGATTAMFSLVDNLLLRPLPFEEADELVTIWNDFSGRGVTQGPLSGMELLDLHEQSRSFASITGYIGTAYTTSGDGDPERLVGARVSSELFNMLGAQPAIGRAFDPGEEKRQDKVVVISHALFERRFGGDRSIVGSAISFDSGPYTVIGVMPESFRFLNDATQVWVPLEINPRVRRNQRGVRVVARLADGVGIEQARSDLAAISRRMAETHPNFYPAEAGHAFRIVPLRDLVVGDVRPMLWTLMAAVSLVLLIGCSNVANLLLVQTTKRERELSLRAAVGADRPRLTRQLLTESLTLALVGGVLGVGLAYLATAAAVRIGLGGLPRLNEVAVDGRVLAFSFAAAVLTGVIFGIVPSLKGSQTQLFDVLKQEGRGNAAGQDSLVRRTLVIAQIALAVVVLIGAGLVLRSFQSVQRVDPGFRSEGLLSARISLPFQRYRTSADTTSFLDAVTDGIDTAPEVESVGAVSILPFSGGFQSGDVEVVGRALDNEEASPQVGWRIVSPNYFETVGIPLLRGRLFTDLDHAEAAPVTLIDHDLAERLWPGANPIGQQLKLIGGFGGDQVREIVGVVGSINETSLETAGELLYIPFAQRSFPAFAIVARVRGDPRSAISIFRNVTRQQDPNLPLTHIETMESLIDSTLDGRRFNRLMFALFGGAALLLTSIGVYSLMAYSVAQRRREIGLRAALGATPESVRTLVLGQSLRLAIYGIVGGVVTAAILTRIFRGTLDGLTFGIGLTDIATYITVPALLAVLALIASYLPAWSASRVDPAIALRHD